MSIEDWIGKIGDPEEISTLLRETKSYISGFGLYEFLEKGSLSGDIDIFATPTAAKLFSLVLPVTIETVFNPIEYSHKAMLKNGIGMIISGPGFEINVCKDPGQSVRNQVVNHSGIYYDGENVNTDAIDLEDPIKLNDLYTEDYLSANPFVLQNINYFKDRGHVFTIEIKPENIGSKLVYSSEWNRFGVTREDMFKFITYFLYKESVVGSLILKINTCLFVYTFEELVTKLNKSKKYFLSDRYQGDIKLLLAQGLLYLYNRKSEEYKRNGIDTSELRRAVEMYSIEHFGEDIENIRRGPYARNSRLDTNKQSIEALREIAEVKDKYDILKRIRNKSRKLEHLEFFTKPSSNPIEEKAYNETKEKMCIDMESLSFYDINSYLKGEAVMAYSEEDEKGNREEVEDYAIEPVSQEIASKRLVFFVASDERLKVVKPYCYNLDLLEKDMATRLYSDTCTASGSYRDIDRGFSNPLFKLSFETNVFVRLNKLLKALYSTKNQAFLLIPTKEVVPRTASLNTYKYGAAVSGDHCQEGTDKRVYRIVVCGKGSDKCYPLNGSIEFRPDAMVEYRTDDRDYDKFLRRYKEEKEVIGLEQENAMLDDMEQE